MAESDLPPLRALIVEDHFDDTTVITSILKRVYALHWLRVDRPLQMRAALSHPWDVILCDYLLPDFPWPLPLRMAQDVVCNVPFVVVSGVVGAHDDAGLVAIRDGAWDVVSKLHLSRLPHVIGRELIRARAIAENYQAQAALLDELAQLKAQIGQADVF